MLDCDFTFAQVEYSESGPRIRFSRNFFPKDVSVVVTPFLSRVCSNECFDCCSKSSYVFFLPFFVLEVKSFCRTVKLAWCSIAENNHYVDILFCSDKVRVWSTTHHLILCKNLIHLTRLIDGFLKKKEKKKNDCKALES